MMYGLKYIRIYTIHVYSENLATEPTQACFTHNYIHIHTISGQCTHWQEVWCKLGLLSLNQVGSKQAGSSVLKELFHGFVHVQEVDNSIHLALYVHMNAFYNFNASNTAFQKMHIYTTYAKPAIVSTYNIEGIFWLLVWILLYIEY